MVKKKKKETFQEFRSNEKSAYTTIKTMLKSVLPNDPTKIKNYKN